MTEPAQPKFRTRIWFAGFTTGVRKTKWYRSRDKAWKAAWAGKCTHVNAQGFRELMGVYFDPNNQVTTDEPA